MSNNNRIPLEEIKDAEELEIVLSEKRISPDRSEFRAKKRHKLTPDQRIRLEIERSELLKEIQALSSTLSNRLMNDDKIERLKREARGIYLRLRDS